MKTITEQQAQELANILDVVIVSDKDKTVGMFANISNLQPRIRGSKWAGPVPQFLLSPHIQHPPMDRADLEAGCMISPMAKLAIAMAAGWGGSDFYNPLPPVPENRGAGIKVCVKRFKHRNAKKRNKQRGDVK